MKVDWRQKFFNNPYQHLLVSLLILLLAFPFVSANYLFSLIFLKAAFLIITISIIGTFKLPRKTRYVLYSIAILAFISNMFARDLYPHRNHPFQWLSQSIDFIFMVLAVLIIVRKIFRDRKITGDTLRGGISVYLMLGILWFQIYTMIYTLDSTAFSRPLTPHQLLYFSFVTLTTVGYGDISPIAPIAMTLANLEAIVGQLYPAIIIARLVALYSSLNSQE